MKMFKTIIISILLFSAAVALFLSTSSSSYTKSIKARYKYMVGDYESARRLAREAFDEDPYNRMAISILAQSKISIQIADYINDAKNYLAKIKKITQKKVITPSDKAKIKMMCEVIIGRYPKLAPTVMTDKALVEEAKKYYLEFKKIYDELFQKES